MTQTRTIVALAVVGLALVIAGLLTGRTAPTMTAAPSPSTTSSTTSSTTRAAIPHPTSSTSSSATATISVQPTPTASAEFDDDDDALVEVANPTQAATTPAEKAAVAAATTFMTAFARPRPASVSSWWPRLEPLLTAQAATDYQGVDPATVPYSKVTGPGYLVPSGSEQDMVLFVSVPTDAGTYLVHLQAGATGGWLVSRLTPPGQS